ncbi:YcxB family protein [Carnobacterium inhibens]|uniref:YcxB-like C-terminal domain-containing protein n=1 Tax=Carnobacterium inhibens subsp. gilichinskyi TaxID=1266845 RepID=U5SCU8_9LACT|nr:YcxB family protein [Carnobacterium inhibens]AGY82886.1 hypothetical protein Q783_10490 [Carnobacterium inhibens subsp. gilichinskyi]
MEEQTIIAKGKPTLKNALQFLMYSVGLVLLMGIVSIYVLVTLYYITTMYGDQRAILMLSLQKAIVPTILLFFLYLFVLSFREYRFIKKRGVQDDKIIFFINKAGITQQKGQLQEILEWSNILKVKEYSDLFIFRHSSTKWSFLPKHYFQTKEDLALFKKMLQEYHTNPSEKSKSQTDFSVKDEYFPSVDDQEFSILAKGNFTFKEYNQYASLLRRKTLLIYVVSAIAMIGLLLRDTFFGANARRDLSMWVLIAIFAVIIALGAALLYSLLKRRTRKEYESDPLTKKEKLYVINEEGISYAVGGSFVQYLWKDFRKVREYKNLFILYVLPQRAVLIPFSLFESPQDVEKAKEIIKNQVDSRNIKFED